MLEYKTKSGVLNQIVTNDINPKKFYLLADGEDGKQYQIKLNGIGMRHNINEFIAHYLGSLSKAPLIDACFLYLEDNELKKLTSKLKSLPNGVLEDIDLSLMKENLFFAIEWKANVVPIEREEELKSIVFQTMNSEAFFSLYSFDQYLKNFDRHIGNHLVIKDGKQKKYYLIDFDRIFMSTNWLYIPRIINDFSPISSQPYHQHLISLVDDNNIKFVHTYANNIETISYDAIKDMCDIISFVYDVQPSEIQKISVWATSRKQQISIKCLENERVFPNVLRKGLYSVS